MIVALDFDGTCVEHDYPRIGADVGAIPWLRRAQELGARFILYTMRDGPELQEARQWLLEREIVLFGVNTNPGQAVWTASPKCYAKLYIDDSALGVPLVRPENRRPYVDWDVAGPILIERVERSRR